MCHVVGGEEMVTRIQGPDKMSLTQLGDYLCMGNSSKGQHTRKKLKRLMSLVPKSCDVKPPVNSAWSLLTEGTFIACS